MSENKAVRFERDKIILTLNIPKEYVQEYKDMLDNGGNVYLSGSVLIPLLENIAGLSNAIQLRKDLKEIIELCKEEVYD